MSLKKLVNSDMTSITSPLAAKVCFQDNCSWLSVNAPQLLEWVKNVIANNSFDIRAAHSSPGQLSIYVDGECWLENVESDLVGQFSHQRLHIDGVSVPQLSNPPRDDLKPGALLAETIDCHSSVLLSVLPNLSEIKPRSQEEYRPVYKNCAILGSLLLYPLALFLEANQSLAWQGIILVEDDPRQLAAALHFFKLADLISLCKLNNIGFSLVCEANSDQLRDRFFALISDQQPLVLHGLQILRSPQRSPALMELHAWIHAREGLQQLTLGMLGFATDELNQCLQAVWSARANRPARLLHPQVVPAEHPVVLVASGPSLDSDLDWLCEHQHQLTIVAAGSALGSLIKAGIQPAAVVYLERDTEVYNQLCDLAADAFDFSDILLLGSSTLDPRVFSLFQESVIFHRPAAAATAYFPRETSAILPQAGPHVVNAALEILLVLGCRHLLLAGCDFGTAQRGHDRSLSALGESPRQLVMAVAGSRNRTVFTEPELLTAHQLFERMLIFTPELKVARLGEGVAMKCAQNVSPDSSLSAEYISNPSFFCDTLRANLPVAQPLANIDHSQLVESANQNLSKISEKLSVSTEWSHALSLELGAMLARYETNLSPAQHFSRALLSQPLFFLFAPLRASTQDNWSHEVKRAIESIRFLQQIVGVYGLLVDQFIKIPRLPIWDPQWVRARARSLDLSVDPSFRMHS